MAKEIKIQSIALTNWRGQTKTVQLDGRDALISGRNKSGKSSILNAFLWCILGVDEQDRSNYLLFDNTVEQTHDNAVPAEVEVSLLVDGNDVVLKRVATQGWVRRRGTDTYERSGSDNYAFFYDGIERSAKQFDEDVVTIFGAPKDKLKIMLNLSYFSSLDWKTQRNALGDIIGEVRPEDFSKDYSFIFAQLDKFTVDDIRERYKAILKPMKDSMERLPIEIETLESHLPVMDGITEAKSKLEQLKKQDAEIDSAIADRSAALKAVMDKRVEETKKIGILKERLEQARQEHKGHLKEDPQLIEAEKDLASAEVQNRNLSFQKSSVQVEVQREKDECAVLENNINLHEVTHRKLKDALAEVKERVFTGDRCAYCGQVLPEDMLETARQKFFEGVEAEKARIVEVGKKNRAAWDAAIKKLQDKKERIKELESKTFENIDLEPLKKNVQDVLANQMPYESTADFAQRMAEIDSLTAAMTEIPQANDSDLTEKKAEIRTEMERLWHIIASEDERNRMLSSIEAKRSELKETAIKVAENEGYLNEIVEYERERANIIRQRVNKLFSICDVQMETVDKSGRTVPTCIINDKDGVDFRVTNSASKFACRIDIANAFSNYYGLQLPIIADNTEMVNAGMLPRGNGQTIRLCVSEQPFNVELL